ncbi:MAG: hypothetical protein KDD82_17590, partial [Planctomycetes bacterium]|nr:hypothetical protein [Planctomycetota bacterium]
LGSRLPPPGLLQALAAAAARRPEAVTPWLAERLPGATAELHQPLGELLGRHGGDAPSSPDARVGHALGLLARDATAGSAAVVGILADAELSPRQRQEALEAFDRAPGDLFLERAREALDAGGGTAELAWVFHDLGQPEDAPRVARLLAAHDYDVANAAVDALAGVLARGELGEHAAPTRAAVREALRLLRAEHPAGQNRLADGLAEALGELEADLSPPASSP